MISGLSFLIIIYFAMRVSRFLKQNPIRRLADARGQSYSRQFYNNII